MLLFLGFGLPLAIYLLVLALINRGSRALMVPGTWDFAGMLMGAFGFLAFGGPAILLALNEQYHGFLIRGEKFPELRGDVWRGLFIGYYVLIVLAAAFLIRRQCRVTAIYNVDPAVFGTVLGEVLTQRQISFVQRGNVLYLKPSQDGSSPTSEARAAAIASDGNTAARPQSTQMSSQPLSFTQSMARQEGVLEVDPSIRFQHVTLRWLSERGSLRQNVENDLRQGLDNVPAPENPAGDWMLIISGFMFLALLLGTATLIVLWMRHAP